MLIERSHIKQKMTIRDRLGSIKAAFTGLPNQSLLTLAQRFSPIYGEPPRRSAKDWIEMYNKSPRMNPVHQIASDVATSAYGMYAHGDPKKIKLVNNPVENLLKKPSPDLTMTEYVLFYITQVYLLLPSGEAFWIKERDGLGRVTQLWPVPPNWVLEIPSLAKPYFSIYPQGNKNASLIPVHPDDLIYFKKPNVRDPYLRGIGRAEQIADEIETDEYAAKFQKRLFFNNGVPPMVGMMPGADQTAVDRQKEKWQQEYGGYNNAHKVAWLNWDAKFQILKETNKDLDFIESRKYLRDISNQHFNIPPELFGILENSNRSTIDAAYYLYTKNVLRKELKFINDTLNLQLVPEFGSDIYLQFDNVVPDDAEFELKKSTEGLKFGALSVNQWLRTNGFDEIGEKGEVIYVPINMVPVGLNEKTADETANLGNVAGQSGGEKPADTVLNGAQIASLLQIVTSVAAGEIPRETGIQIIINAFMFDRETAERIMDNAGGDFAPAAEYSPPEPPPKSSKALTPEHKNRIWLTFDKAAIKNERSFINALKKYFQAQQDKINAALEKGVKAITDNPDELLNWTEEEKTLLATLKPLWLTSMTEALDVANDTFGFGISFDVMNPKFLDWVKEFGAKQVKGINETTKTKLQITLTEGVKAGEGIPKLRDRVSTVMTEAKTSRAKKIALTETHNTVGAGTFETYGAANVKQKEWLTSLDGRERDSHAAINGEVVAIDESFSNGLMYPGDASGPADEVVNCRCTLLPVLPGSD